MILPFTLRVSTCSILSAPSNCLLITFKSGSPRTVSDSRSQRPPVSISTDKEFILSPPFIWTASQSRCRSEPNLVANTFEHFKNANISLNIIDNLHVQCPPPWEEHNITVDISLTKQNKENTSEVAYQKEFFRIKGKFSNHYAVFTDGSKLEEKVAAAAYFPEHPDRSKATRLRDGASVFSAELEGIALTLTEIKKLTKYHKNFVIYSDSLSALQAIQSKNFKVIDIRRLYNLIRKFPPYVY
ncbi:RNA-directed DNA polymerase from mobile element jockey [Plakobranchus ocellatus]|uniref:RNA-directed DNA polymerase from mobile element jockey n=1 Tax=Plakobranchus ocellatus TaxID=259542 RepID=A0AAV3YF57_9GAST|nr:RNA-directed DNA polymerase from mobile element jockey [Plakobranchus ocellatus]